VHVAVAVCLFVDCFQPVSGTPAPMCGEDEVLLVATTYDCCEEGVTLAGMKYGTSTSYVYVVGVVHRIRPSFVRTDSQLSEKKDRDETENDTK
jgi:hypothetical protein